MRRSVGATISVWFLRLVIVAIVAVVLFVPPFSTLTAGEQSAAGETARILDYSVEMDLDADGGLSAVETVQVEMPPGKHGIFRTFDLRDATRDDLDHDVTDVTVTRDGADEPFTWVGSGARTRTARIGAEDVILPPGVHTYVITWRTDQVLEQDPDGNIRWWWDVVGSGWQMPMQTAHVTVELPAEVDRVECVQGEDTPCTPTVQERRLEVTAGPLEPFTPVTLRVTFPEGSLPTPAGPSSNTTTIVLSILAGLVGAALGFLFIARTRERQPGFPVVFEPPPRPAPEPGYLSPAVGYKVLHETHSDEDLQATLYDLGERGVVRLDGDDSAWRVNLLVDPVAASLPELDRAVLAALGLVDSGDAFLVTKSVSSGETVSSARSVLRSQVNRETEPFLDRSASGLWSKGLGWLAVIALIALAAFHLFSVEGLASAWWPVLIGIAAFAFVNLGVMLDPGTGTTRSEAGRDVWSRTGGFSRFLTTDSSESRFDAAAHMDWYPRYLPWALVFGAADAWARRYEEQGVALPYVPYIYWSGTHGFTASSMSDSFNSTIASASAAYAASQSSSGGGGGFSGGSGGGGGGGGSW